MTIKEDPEVRYIEDGELVIRERDDFDYEKFSKEID